MKKRLLMLLSLFMAVTSVGWVHASARDVSTVEELKQAIKESPEQIYLNADTFKLTEQLVINKAVLISGNKEKPAVIIADGNNWSGDNSKKNLISIQGEEAGTVTLQNLCIKGSRASGINAQSAMNTILTNVTLEGNTNAGLLVHSVVDAQGLVTKLNGWGGVNVDKGSTQYAPSFTFDVASTFEEESKIWSELEDSESIVKAPIGWRSYLGVQGTSTKKMRYWTNSKLTFENVTNFYTDKTLNEGFTLIYANGNPITVEASGTDTVKISAGTDDVLEVATAKNPIIFGGAKFADVESSSITMKSGKVYMLVGGGYLGNVKNANVTVDGGNVTKYLVGGGYGPKQAFSAAERQTANVTNAIVKINEGATVRYLISGGLMYAKTIATDIQITKAAIEYALGGGYAPVSINQSEQTDFATNVNTIGTAKFSMTGGTVKGAICLGGGYSYSYTKNITATIDNVNITGGLYGIGWNGRSDKVNATIKNSSFTKPESGYSTIASLVRGKADEISMAFNDCTFADQYECYLSADKDWQDGAFPTPVSGKTTITFVGENTPVVKVSEGMQDVTVIGAKVKVEKFLQKKESTFIDKFEVPSGKTWSFPKGMTIAKGVTLANKGTLNVKGIDNVADLQSAIAVGANSIGLTANTFELPSHLLINNSVVIEGTITAKDSTIIKQASNWSGSDGTNKNLIRIDASNTTLKNLLVEGSKTGSGIHVYNTKDVTLDNVISRNNTAAGLIVNGSTVTADKLTTEGNAWGGIEVGKGKDVTTDPKLTISNSTIKEKSQIWADTNPSVEGSAEIAKWVAGTGWNMFVEQPTGKNYEQTFWSQKTKIQINVTKSTFFYDENKYTVQYTTTPADVKDITVTYYDIKDGKPNGEGTIDGKKAIGSYYAIFTRDADETYLALNDTVTMSINAKGVPSVSSKPTYTTVEAGQPLSMSLLEGGEAKVDGVTVLGSFAWADANMILKEGAHNYAVVFTPANLAEMEVAIDSVKIDAKRYFTVTTGVSANGKATITGKSASNRYVNGTELDFVITPETGYEFTGWNGTNNMVTKYEVEKDTSFVAGFAKKKFTVTIASANNGSVAVNVGGNIVISGTSYPYGTILTVTATADENYTADAITTTGSAIAKGQIFLDADTEISATFKEKPTKPQQVNVKASEGGTVRLTADGKEIVAGSYVAEGTTIIVERTPNKGYKLENINQARTTETVGNSALTITSSFVKELYTITAKTGDGYTLTVDKTEGNYGDQVTVGYAVNAGYKAVALMVNAKEVPNNSTFTLTENTTVQAIVKEKATIAVNKDDQSYVYNGHNQPFVVKTTPAGLDSVSVSYTKGGTTVSTPVDAGTYTVHINRPEDENFKALSATATLVITKAPIVITARPTAADGTGGAASVAGTWSSGEKPGDAVQPMTKALKSTPDVAIFTPTSSNYAVGYCAPGSDMNMKVTITQPTGGTITVWDGNLQIDGSVSSNNALQGTELLAIATPAEGYKFSEWTSGIVENGKEASTIVKPSSSEITFAAKFVEKKPLTPLISNATAVYDGTAKGGNLSISSTEGNIKTGWSYSFQQNGITVVPVNAGKYDVVVTRAADADYKACRVVLTNAFEIKRTTPSITTKPAATLAKGAMLHSAEVTGGVASTDGTFVWKSANDAINADATDKMMIFVPSDKDNFQEVEVTGVAVKTTNLQVISFVQPENGTIIVKRGETVLASGDPIAVGDELIITATAASGYELESLKVAGEAFTNGSTYRVEGDATVNVVATMTKTQSGGGDPVVPVSVSSVSLDKSALTLPRLESYTLIATVNPSDATNKSVTWKSSDESIAKVDANGKVTAVKIGKATITVTTVDGNKTATCLVTVDFATGIEEMLAQTEVYSQQGNIIVNPVQPLQLTIVNMTGQTVYNDYISGSTQIPARSGVYIVKLSNTGNTIISKLIVR